MERTYRLFQQDYVLMKQRHEHTSTGGYTSEVNYFQMPGRVAHRWRPVIFAQVPRFI